MADKIWIVIEKVRGKLVVRAEVEGADEELSDLALTGLAAIRRARREEKESLNVRRIQ